MACKIIRRIVLCVASAMWFALGWTPDLSAQAQPVIVPGGLSDTLKLDEPSSATRSHLQRIESQIQQQQWDEAIETLRQVLQEDDGRVIQAQAGQWIPVREYCQRKLATLPNEALASYRDRVDAVAERWYEQGVKQRDEQSLTKLIDELFASSWGDNALYALGEIAFEQGDYSRARASWERISPELKLPDGTPLWLAFRGVDVAEQASKLELYRKEFGGALGWLPYPDTELNLAPVRARLAIVSIFEGSLQRAAVEISLLAHYHPGSKGKLAGREVVLSDALKVFLDAARTAKNPPVNSHWLTFAGSTDRTKIESSRIDIAGPAWVQPIEWSSRLEASVADNLRAGLPTVPVGEEFNELLSYHPVLVDDLLILANEHQVAAFDVHTGKPAFLPETPVIYPASDQAEPFRTKLRRSSAIGVPRFTATAHDRKLYARLGSPVTSRAGGDEIPGRQASVLVCLDLDRQGGLVQLIQPEDARWSFEGTPVADDRYLYVSMRYTDVRSQVHVACFETHTGRLVWRKFVCAAETVGRGAVDEITHNLLTLHGNTLYLNSNHGVVVAIEKQNGHVRWLHAYGKVNAGEISTHLLRDLNPCIYFEDLILVAPSDTQSIFALDASTGALVWENNSIDDVVHLLGVGGGNLLASGHRLWWLDVYGGKAIARFPVQASPTMKGYGRGVLSGDEVYWPTRSEVYVFGQNPKRDRSVAIPERQPILLTERGFGSASGGNLLVAGDKLLVVSPESIFAYGSGSPRTAGKQDSASTHSGSASGFAASTMRMPAPVVTSNASAATQSLPRK